MAQKRSSSQKSSSFSKKTARKKDADIVLAEKLDNILSQYQELSPEESLGKITENIFSPTKDLFLSKGQIEILLEKANKTLEVAEKTRDKQLKEIDEKIQEEFSKNPSQYKKFISENQEKKKGLLKLVGDIRVLQGTLKGRLGFIDDLEKKIKEVIIEIGNLKDIFESLDDYNNFVKVFNDTMYLASMQLLNGKKVAYNDIYNPIEKVIADPSSHISADLEVKIDDLLSKVSIPLISEIKK